MHRILNIIIITAATLGVSAQTIDFNRIKREAPDLDEIRRETYDRNSPYYYPRLYAEFQRNDTIMKLDKYRRLYLGYMFQEDYNPYRVSPVSAAHPAPTPEAVATMTHQQCDSVIKYATEALADTPFDLSQMEALIAAHRYRGNKGLADIWQYKFNYILMAIASTGTGADEESAWYVTEAQHEYVLLNKMGLTITNHIFYAPNFEYLKVTGSDGISGGVYFNIEGILQEYFRKFPDEL